MSEVKYDILAYEENTGITTLHRFDYLSGFNSRNLVARNMLCECGAKVDDICTINGVLNIRVVYSCPDFIDKDFSVK